MSDLIDVVLPEDQVEGSRSQVQRWLKAAGESVKRHEPLIEIETDKVTVEVAAPADGVLAEIVAAEGTDVAPGAVLGRLRASSAGVTTAPAPPPKPAAPAPTGVASAAMPGGGGRLSPAVRRLLTERGLRAEDVAGSGEGGRITVEDVLAAKPQDAAAAGVRAAAAPGEEGVRPIPHTPMRRRIAAHMVESLLRTAPHVTTVFQADMTAVLADRARRKAEFERRGESLTLTAYFIAACVDAIRAVPEANARWTADAILVHERIDIGVGTALPGRGLVVPVIRDCGRLDLAGIATALGALVQKARDDALAPADLQGGTFTISNHGVSGSLVAAPIVINQPQSAILGIGKLEKRAVVVSEDGEDQVVIRPCSYVTLTIDHRVLDGHQANHFMQTLVNRLEAWS
ncbi:MAG TPA: 2-oxo acid dehydrogenase subunit E2 [Steroidobacteraceae bacterium]|jgi:2-oxoglutarate dehydrogenase E2 component (dihydrolipoamide succinyltransferase)|nr:2-oxo acid dehydrogenase subunit E2 [Steroidobacteraceae bacterium]